MGKPAAKQGDMVVAVDIHIIMIPAPPGPPVPTTAPHPFAGALSGNLCPTVKIMGMPAATVGSTATNQPPHIPILPGPFQVPPNNQATILMGSSTVMIGKKPAARMGDKVQTCADPAPNMAANLIATSTVMIGG